MILHALVITERRELDLDVWNNAIDSVQKFDSKKTGDSSN